MLGKVLAFGHHETSVRPSVRTLGRQACIGKVVRSSIDGVGMSAFAGDGTQRDARSRVCNIGDSRSPNTGHPPRNGHEQRLSRKPDGCSRLNTLKILVCRLSDHSYTPRSASLQPFREGLARDPRCTYHIDRMTKSDLNLGFRLNYGDCCKPESGWSICSHLPSKTSENEKMNQYSDDHPHSLLAVHRRWAFYALQRLALHDLSLNPILFENGFKFLIVVGDVGPRLTSIEAHFHEKIQPVTADISIAASAPPGFAPVVTTATLRDDMWSTYVPLSVSNLNQMLALIDKSVPKGGIDYINDTDRWQFQHFGIDDIGRQAVRDASAVLGIVDEIDFLEVTAPEPDAERLEKRFADNFAIETRHVFPATSSDLRRLVERDEDTWRSFVAGRGERTTKIDEPKLAPIRFECLYDTRDDGPIQLAELLTLYDVVNIVPGQDTTWLQRHQLSLADLEVMAAMGRIKLVLPNTIRQYPEELIQAAISHSDENVVLSRDLATRVIQNGEKKDPLLYGPFTTDERTSLLRHLHQGAPDDAFKKLLSAYSSSFVQHGFEYAVRGANAGYRIGIGAFLGEVLYQLQGIDARVEMSVLGAAMEWSMGLGAAYVPRQMGGFDETHNASIIASHVSRSRFVPAEPLANRMHTVVSGLLAVTDVPPLEVAKSFTSNTISRFRHVAMGLVSGPSNVDELSGLVKKLNDDVRAFERRRERLSKWSIDTALVGLAGKLLMDPLDAKIGPWTSYFSSLIAGYLYNALKNSKAFEVVGGMSREVIDLFIGLALAPSNDSVIMSRTQNILKR